MIYQTKCLTITTQHEQGQMFVKVLVTIQDVNASVHNESSSSKKKNYFI